MKPWMRYALIGVAGLVLGIVIAKYTLPPRVVVKTEIKTEVQERVVYKDRVVVEKGPERVTTRTVTVPGPAGPTVTVEKVVEKEKIVTVRENTGRTDVVIQNEERSEKIVDSRPWLALEAAGSVAPATGRWAWSGGAQIRLLGPIWAGVGVVKADTWYVGPSARIEF